MKPLTHFDVQVFCPRSTFRKKKNCNSIICSLHKNLFENSLLLVDYVAIAIIKPNNAYH